MNRELSHAESPFSGGICLVEGHQLQLTNADQSRTFVGIYLHENRLYILKPQCLCVRRSRGCFSNL